VVKQINTKEWFTRLEHYGIKSRDVDASKQKLSKKFGFERTDRDVIWSLYTDKIHDAIKQGNLHLLKILNWDMALFLQEEGKEFFECMQESQKMHLMEYKQQRLAKVRIISAGGCPACINMIGKVLAIDVALKEMPIPVKDCTFKLHGRTPGWCRCRYVPYFDDPKLDTPDSYYEDLKKKRVSELR
jgi:hypothetical protein